MDYIRVGWGVKNKTTQRNKQQEGSHLASYSIGINLPSLRPFTSPGIFEPFGKLRTCLPQGWSAPFYPSRLRVNGNEG
jgi:hypothetical protein